MSKKSAEEHAISHTVPVFGTAVVYWLSQLINLMLILLEGVLGFVTSQLKGFRANTS